LSPLSDQHSNRYVDQNRRPGEIGDASREPSGEIARCDLVREAGLERERRIALAHVLGRDIVRDRDRDPQHMGKRFSEALQSIEIERVGAGADAEEDRGFEMVEMPRGASGLEDRHDRGDARAAGDTDNRALFLGREDRLAQWAEPLDGITRPRTGEQPIRERPIRLSLDHKFRLRRGTGMIGHRIAAVAGKVRDAEHRELARIELQGGIELEHQLDGVLRERIDAPDDAPSEVRPDPGRRSQVRAARNLETAVAERAGLAQQHLVAIGPQIGTSGRLSPIADDHAGETSRLAGSAGAGRAFVGHRYARPQRRVEQRLLRFGPKRAARGFGPHFDQRGSLRGRPRGGEGEVLCVGHANRRSWGAAVMAANPAGQPHRIEGEDINSAFGCVSSRHR
jgi:hypothetical protein